jgi:hypothetical protein
VFNRWPMSELQRLAIAFALLLFCEPALRADPTPKSDGDAALGVVGRLNQSGGKFVSYSRDGKKLLTSNERKARVWDAIALWIANRVIRAAVRDGIHWKHN